MIKRYLKRIANEILNEVLEELEFDRAVRKLDRMERTLNDINTRVAGITTIRDMVARLHAERFPKFAWDESKPEKRAESARIAKEQIARIEAEDAVRREYGYTPEDK